MKERDVTSMLRRSLEAAGFWAYKIPDPPRGAHPIQSGGKRPFDLVASKYGRLVAIEVKMSRGFKAFGPRNLAEHQHEQLAAVQRIGAVGVVALVVWIPRHVKRLFMWRHDKLERATKSDLEAAVGINPSGDDVWPLDWLDYEVTPRTFAGGYDDPFAGLPGHGAG